MQYDEFSYEFYVRDRNHLLVEIKQTIEGKQKLWQDFDKTYYVC